MSEMMINGKYERKLDEYLSNYNLMKTSREKRAVNLGFTNDFSLYEKL